LVGREFEEWLDHQRGVGGVQSLSAPPLDGGRILVGVLPKAIAAPVARLEPYGIAILLGLLIVLPMLGAQLGVDLSIVSHIITVSTGAILDVILRLTGNV
jgi:Zn-dependent protease